MTTNKLLLDDLFNLQDKQGFLATIEPLSDDTSKVKVTPWSADNGCLCSYAVNVNREMIETVEPTGDKHYCCDKTLLVVQINFKDQASIGLNELFQSIVNSVKKKTPSHTNIM